MAVCFSYLAQAASLNLSSSGGSYQVGQTFDVRVNVNPGEDNIDTVRAKLSFSQQQLEIEKFSLDSSYTFPTGSNGYNNDSGTFSYGAGVPGGTGESGTFGVVTFKVKAPGEAKITISPDSLVLSGGENKMAGGGQTVSYTLAAPASQQQSSSTVKTVPKTDKGSQQKNDETAAVQENPNEDSGNQPENATTTPFNSIDSSGDKEDPKVVILGSEEPRYDDKVQIIHWSLKKKIIFFVVVGIALLAATTGIMYFCSKCRRRLKIWPL